MGSQFNFARSINNVNNANQQPQVPTDTNAFGSFLDGMTNEMDGSDLAFNSISTGISSARGGSSILGTIGSVAGGVVGGIYGGPAGAAAGSAAGGMAGNAIMPGQKPQQQQQLQSFGGTKMKNPLQMLGV